MVFVKTAGEHGVEAADAHGWLTLTALPAPSYVVTTVLSKLLDPGLVLF